MVDATHLRIQLQGEVRQVLVLTVLVLYVRCERNQALTTDNCVKDTSQSGKDMGVAVRHEGEDYIRPAREVRNCALNEPDGLVAIWIVGARFRELDNADKVRRIHFHAARPTLRQ